MYFVIEAIALFVGSFPQTNPIWAVKEKLWGKYPFSFLSFNTYFIISLAHEHN